MLYNSRRYPILLRFVVERALDGHSEPLKERTLGVEVFGREPDYDTNLDPVVRTTACEIRKRIAQYYHDASHETEIRIEFPAGTYVPEFRLPPRPACSEAATEVATPPMKSRAWVAIGAGAILIASAALTLAAMGSRPNSLAIHRRLR